FPPSLRGLAGRLVFAPDMKRVSENNVAHDAAWIVIAEINRGIELEIARQVAGKTDRGGIFASALPIDLEPPGFVEIVGVTENRFVFVTGMDRADDEFVVLQIISGFDVGLWIDIQMWRPIHESDRQKIRFLS